MILDSASAESLRVYQTLVGLIVPRPIAWVSTPREKRPPEAGRA